MTREELEKEAKESWWNDNNCSGALPTKKIYEYGYLAGAESREKRIEELEEENAELKARLQKKINTTTVSDYPYSALKLEEAKELLNEFMRISKASDEDFEHDYSELIGETEQFLKE